MSHSTGKHEDNDLDGFALAAVVDQGPESLKEVIPSLGKRLKLIHALKSFGITDQLVQFFCI